MPKLPRDPRYGRNAARKIVDKPKGRNPVLEFQETQLKERLANLEIIPEEKRSGAEKFHIEKIKRRLGFPPTRR